MLIEIFSDIVCPWCYIGKRRLDQVLDDLQDDQIQIRWRAFQLYPMLPSDGLPRAEFMRARFGAGADPSHLYRQVLQEAAPLGLALDFAAIRRAPNTRLAHRLLAWVALGAAQGAVQGAGYRAAAQGSQHTLAETLFRYYFTEGRDLSDARVLAEAAAESGFDHEAASQALASGAGAAAVDADLARAREAEITGVPLYLLGGRFAIPGAQQPDVLRHFIERARLRLASG